MIQINFPPDPSQLVFLLSPRVPHVYLLARAVRHYGANNLTVFDTSHINHPEAVVDVDRMQVSARIADALGLKHIRYPTIDPTWKIQGEDSTASELNRNKLKDAALEAIRHYAPEVSDHIDGIWSSSLIQLYGIITSIQSSSSTASGIDNNVGNLLDIGDIKLALPVIQLHSDLVELSDNKHHPAILAATWAPIAAYSMVDIIKSAHEEGILDLLSAVPHCHVDNTTPCGSCDGCLHWKMQLIEAEVI